jgi:predicted DNA-binding protein (UPF0278 family)
VLDFLEETSKLDVKLTSTPMKPNKKIYLEVGEPLKDVGQYQRFVSKIIYLIVTRSDNAFFVSLMSQFMYASIITHLEVVDRILRYLKESPGQYI